MLCLLHMTVDHLHDEISLRYILRYLMTDHLTLIVRIKHLLLHHALTHGRHLRTMLRVHDRSHDVTTKRRTNLIEQVLVALARLLVLMATNLQRRTVSRQTTGQRRRDTRSQVTANHRSTHQTDLRLLLLKKVDQDVRMRQRGIGEKTRCVEHVHPIHTIR